MVKGRSDMTAEMSRFPLKSYSYKSASARTDPDSPSFLVEDVRGLVPGRQVIQIVLLESAEPGNGHATEVLKMIARDNQDHLIVLKAAPTGMDPETTSRELYDEKTRALVKFYEKRGFVDINSLVGYKNGVAMCYRNEAFSELQSAMTALEMRGRQLKVVKGENTMDSGNASLSPLKLAIRDRAIPGASTAASSWFVIENGEDPGVSEKTWILGLRVPNPNGDVQDDGKIVELLFNEKDFQKFADKVYESAFPKEEADT